ncbi:hypothetical protein V5799_025601 [Amblyomma americanum]|uniref:Uncharacterized protein n=1 Tax=Amblyomma americanum TaxID=6943 RepID=A0AAQ4E927_AMBAM
MRAILGFKNLEEENSDQCPCGESLRELLSGMHDDLVGRLKAACTAEEDSAEGEGESTSSLRQKLMSLVNLVKSPEEPGKEDKEHITLPEGTNLGEMGPMRLKGVQAASDIDDPLL